MTAKDTKTTRYQPTYWSGNGEMQDIYDALSAALVPFSGAAPTTHGNALRWMGNVYHEVYNNGGGNACESRSWDYERSRTLTKRYRDGINIIVNFAELTESEARCLRNALRYGEEMCNGGRPVSSKRLDAIVTKVVKAVLMAHLASLSRPACTDLD